MDVSSPIERHGQSQNPAEIAASLDPVVRAKLETYFGVVALGGLTYWHLHNFIGANPEDIDDRIERDAETEAAFQEGLQILIDFESQN